MYGRWKVTTEGDCEGRSIVDLGTHEGYLDDIAFALADKAYYQLCFQPAPPVDLTKITGTSVNIAVRDAEWDEITLDTLKQKLASRDVTVEYQAGILLTKGKTEQSKKEAERQVKINQLKDKLAKAGISPEDLELLKGSN